ncbi:MAG: hypothetical protein KF886_05815 [Candidatus Hydrogenedentes bacterium]|nr:hypothetical protein [Candidatus Hydrogenedentota bacterium]
MKRGQGLNDTSGERETVRLNAVEIQNSSALTWNVNIYRLRPCGHSKSTHESRGDVKSVVWNLKKHPSSSCRGFGFVVDFSPEFVAVPNSWNLASDIEFEGYLVTKDGARTVSCSNGRDWPIVAGIIRESLKKHRKENRSEKLGDFWQDYNSFCQVPEFGGRSDVVFCRRFLVNPEMLRGGLPVLQFVVTTTGIDRRSFGDYFKEGRVEELLSMVDAKRENRLKRSGEKIAARLLHCPPRGQIAVLDFNQIDYIKESAELSTTEQRARKSANVSCIKFGSGALPVPMDEIHLILGTQNTGEMHRETIILPEDRRAYINLLRDYFSGIDLIGGQTLELATSEIDVSRIWASFVSLPDIRVKGQGAQQDRILAPSSHSADALRERYQKRKLAIEKNGFLQEAMLKPALAVTTKLGDERASRLLDDVNLLCVRRSLPLKFDLLQYDSVSELSDKIQQGEFGAALVVLPENSKMGARANDTHDLLKRELHVPSQCMYSDSILPEKWTSTSWEALKTHDIKLVRRINNRYVLCIDNLLIKACWIPFLPASPMNFNVHIGIDVGGAHNHTAFISVGYGFSSLGNSDAILCVFADRLHIPHTKAEPIPSESLHDGILSILKNLREKLASVGVEPDLERVLFVRDGSLLGQKDDIDEKLALSRLASTCRSKGWISSEATWATVEVHKRAENWKLFTVGPEGTDNPLVGQIVKPFDEDSKVLACTTGRPTLTQGTASPLILRCDTLLGELSVDDIVRDIVWEADMGYTKPDMGRSLPWILHIADEGALQASQGYQITGITA